MGKVKIKKEDKRIYEVNRIWIKLLTNINQVVIIY